MHSAIYMFPLKVIVKAQAGNDWELETIAIYPIFEIVVPS